MGARTWVGPPREATPGLLALWLFFFFNDPATTEISTLSLHDALLICMIISEKQQEANRKNAQHSSGPKTPEGHDAHPEDGLQRRRTRKHRWHRDTSDHRRPALRPHQRDGDDDRHHAATGHLPIGDSNV